MSCVWIVILSCLSVVFPGSNIYILNVSYSWDSFGVLVDLIFVDTCYINSACSEMHDYNLMRLIDGKYDLCRCS